MQTCAEHKHNTCIMNGTTEDNSIMFFNVSAAQCDSLMLSGPQDSSKKKNSLPNLHTQIDQKCGWIV